MLIIGLLFSVVLPSSKEIYDRYRGNLYAEKILLFLSEMRREAFLYGMEIEITLQDGALKTREGKFFKPEIGKIDMPEPIIFYPLGTSRGGKLFYHYGKITFLIEVKAPFGEILLSESYS